MSYLKDFWSWIHCFGSCALNCVIFSCIYFFHQHIIVVLYASIITLILGGIWELCDEIYSRSKRTNLDWLFDNRGWDVRDMRMNCLGIGISILIILALIT